MEFSEEDKQDVFSSIFNDELDLFVRYDKFPRRIDLFPIAELSIAQTLNKQLSKSEKEDLQSDVFIEY